MEILALAALTALLGGAFLLVKKQEHFAFVVIGDEDMKIASPGGYSRNKGEDAAELAAKQFLMQKSSGNIDKARELGKMLAEVLLELPGELFDPEADDDQKHHNLLLYSYVVNRVIGDKSPNSILAQTSLNVFYDTLEEASLELCNHVSDTAAFSLYILCERSNSRSTDEIGQTYAALLGRAANQTLIDQGNDLYRSYYDYCRKKRDIIHYTVIVG